MAFTVYKVWQAQVFEYFLIQFFSVSRKIWFDLMYGNDTNLAQLFIGDDKSIVYCNISLYFVYKI